MIILFEVNNDVKNLKKGENPAFEAWAVRHLDTHLAYLTSSSHTDAEKEKYLAEATRLRAYFDPRKGHGYVRTYTALREAIKTWLTTNGAKLDTYLPAVSQLMQVIEQKEGHEGQMRAGLSNALAALPRLPAPSPAPVGPGSAVKPTAQAPVPAPKPAASAPVPVPKPAPAQASVLGSTRIIEIASRHGLGGFGKAKAMAIAFRGGDPFRALADVLVLAGMRDGIEVTDVLFEVVHPELGGGRIPEGATSLVGEWVALRRQFADPAVTAAKAAATPPGSSGTTAPAGSAGTTPTTATPTPTDAGTAPTQTPVGGTTDGAKEMDPNKRKEAIESAVKQITTVGEAEDREAIQAVLRESNTTTEAWFGDLVPNAMFLDVTIRPSGGTVPGVHKKLDAKLRKAEERLVQQFPTLTKAQIAKKMGIYEISGMRPPKKATGGSLPSYHCFGLAVDINHPTNPFVGNKKPVKNPKMTAEQLVKYQEFMQNRSPRIIERAMLLIRNTKFDIENIAVPKGPGTKAGRLWEVHHEASETLAEYLMLASDLDGQRLRNLVDSLQKSGDTRDLNWWKQRIRDDRVLITPSLIGQPMKHSWDFMQHKAPEKTGYLDLAKELVEALAAAGLEWGGGYGGAKDMMHFDLRDGSITRPRPGKKKKK